VRAASHKRENNADVTTSFTAYRTSLISHIMDIDLRHWDPNVRLLGAQSLKAIAEFQPDSLIVTSADRAVRANVTAPLGNSTC
jgi:hypothetical protein